MDFQAVRVRREGESAVEIIDSRAIDSFILLPYWDRRDLTTNSQAICVRLAMGDWMKVKIKGM